MTNHKDEAESLTRMLAHHDEHVADVAQLHATLYLAEQQRIANLITIAGWLMDSTAEDVGYDLDKLRTGVAGEVWEGLGLS